MWYILGIFSVILFIIINKSDFSLSKKYIIAFIGIIGGLLTFTYSIYRFLLILFKVK